MADYWVARARGADFKVLKGQGFLVFYPVVDDYVFLEALDENKNLLSKQDELRIRFLRDSKGRDLVKVTDRELQVMQGRVKDNLVPGLEILVVEGYCSGLDGKIISRQGDTLYCEVYGFRKVFEVELTPIQVVERGSGSEGDS